MHQVYLSLGSNIGNREKHLLDALNGIENSLGTIQNCSSIYETEAWGFDSDNPFYNLVVQIASQFELIPFFKAMQELELELGRTQKSKDANYQDRTIDIDLLFFDQLLYDSPELTVPHSHFSDRNFVLFPLAEINPNLFCPKNKKKIAALLALKNVKNFSKIKKKHKIWL